MLTYIRGLLDPRRESGATAVEYSILAMAIAAVIVAIVLLLGRQTRDNFCDVGDAFGETGEVDPADVSSACP